MKLTRIPLKYKKDNVIIVCIYFGDIVFKFTSLFAECRQDIQEEETGIRNTRERDALSFDRGFALSRNVLVYLN